MVYTIQRQTEKFGPYDITQVRAMTGEGKFSATDLVWQEDSPTPTTVAALLQGAEGGSTTAATPAIFKKGPALTAFYLAAAALIPVVGFFCAVPAFFFGLKGLKATRGEPQGRERLHALVGVFVGGFLTLLYLFMIGYLAFGFGTRK